MGIGVQEAVIILAIVVLLFGTPILTFLLGYLAGKNRAQAILGEQAPPPSVSTPTEERSTDE